MDTIFKDNPTEDQIESSSLGKTDYQYQVTKSTKDKLQLLDIKGELSASIMSGMIKVSGSGRYLKDTRTKVNSSSMTCKLYVQTEQDIIFLRKGDLKDKADMNVVKDLGQEGQEATHVVTGILYGASGLVEAKYSFSDSQEQQRIEGSLGAKFQTLGLSIDSNVEMKHDEKNNETYENFTFSWQCDVGDDDANLPITFEKAVEKMTTLPKLIKGDDGEGRGVPIKFWLTPLKQVADMWKEELQAHVAYSTIAEDSLTDVMKYYTKVEENILKLQDLVANLTHDEALVRKERLQEAQDALTAGEKEEAKLKMILKAALLSIRSGGDTQVLDQWKLDFEDGVLSDSKIHETTTAFHYDLKIKKLMSEAQKEGVQVLKKGDFLPDRGHQFVLYTKIFDEELINESDNLRKIFMNLKETETKIPKASSEEDSQEDAKTQFYWVDHDVWGGDFGDTEISIIERKFGRIKDKSIKERYETQLEKNLIDMSEGEPWDQEKVSSYARNFEVKCPNFFKSRECNSEKRTWMCKRCNNGEEKPIQLDALFNEEGKIAIIVCTSCEMACQFSMPKEGPNGFFKGSPSFKCDSLMDHGLYYVTYGEEFEAQIKPLVQQIEDELNADQIPEEFDEHDLDGDGKLTPDEAKPLFRKFEDLAHEVGQLKVSIFTFTK